MIHYLSIGVLGLGLAAHMALNDVTRNVPVTTPLNPNNHFNQLMVEVERRTVNLVYALEPAFYAGVDRLYTILTQPQQEDPSDILFLLPRLSNRLQAMSSQNPPADNQNIPMSHVNFSNPPMGNQSLVMNHPNASNAWPPLNVSMQAGPPPPTPE